MGLWFSSLEGARSATRTAGETSRPAAAAAAARRPPRPPRAPALLAARAARSQIACATIQSASSSRPLPRAARASIAALPSSMCSAGAACRPPLSATRVGGRRVVAVCAIARRRRGASDTARLRSFGTRARGGIVHRAEALVFASALRRPAAMVSTAVIFFLTGGDQSRSIAHRGGAAGVRGRSTARASPSGSARCRRAASRSTRSLATAPTAPSQSAFASAGCSAERGRRPREPPSSVAAACAAARACRAQSAEDGRSAPPTA